MRTRLFTRIASWFEAQSPPAQSPPAAVLPAGVLPADQGPRDGAWEQGNAAIADVTRWGWLPALSGVCFAADYAAILHTETAAAASEG
jgi:hypothetical protein